MSSCDACSSGCNCGSECGCNGCSCCKRNPDLGEERITTTQTIIPGAAPQKGQFEGSELAAETENGGCKCEPTCTCDPCNCK